MANYKTIAFNIILIGFVINSVSFAFAESGVAADWGVDPDPGGDSAISNVQTNAEKINPANGLGATLFATFQTVASVGNLVLSFMYAVPDMIDNLPGVPSWIPDMFRAVLSLFWFGAIAYLLAGRIV